VDPRTEHLEEHPSCRISGLCAAKNRLTISAARNRLIYDQWLPRFYQQRDVFAPQCAPAAPSLSAV